MAVAVAFAAKLRIAGRDGFARQVRKCEIEMPDSGAHGGQPIRIRKRSAGIALGSPFFVKGHSGPKISRQTAVRHELRLVQEHVRTIKGRQIHLIAFHQTGNEAMIAGGRQESAGDGVMGLAELPYGRFRSPALIGECDRPSP